MARPEGEAATLDVNLLTRRRRTSTAIAARITHCRTGIAMVSLAVVIAMAMGATAAHSALVAADGAKRDAGRPLETPTSGSDRQAPRPPANLVSSSVSATTVTLTWSAARDNVGVAGYGSYVDRPRVGTTVARSFTFAGLACGKTYKFGIDAFDATRNRSAISWVLAATKPCLDASAPSPPSNLRQSGWGESGVGIEWSQASDNVGVAGYSVYRDGVPVAVTQQSSTWLGNLVCGAGYAVSVEAYDAAGNRSARSTAVVRTTACADTTPPGAPPSLTVSSSSQSMISIAWQPANDDRGVAGYRTSLNGVEVGTTTGTSTTFTGLACARSYVVKVVAFDAAGNASPAASTTAATAPCPASASLDTQPPTTPGSLSRSGGSQLSVALSWTPSTDNVAIAGYGVYRGATKVADSSATAFVLGGLACGVSYSVGVDAVDVSGNRSGRAAIVVATDPCQDVQVPSAPTSLGSTGRTESTITLSWQPASDNVAVTGYRVFRGATQVGSTASTSYTATGLTCGTSYTFGVEAYDGSGNHSSRAATIVSTAACSDAVAPSTPTSLLKTGSTTTSVSLSWSAASDNVAVAGYSLYVAGALIGTTAQTAYSFGGLTCGVTYALGVEAYDVAGNRSPRASLSTATAACGTPAPPTPAAGSVYVSTTGSDANPCTQAQPCLSFGRAYKAAAPGANVFVAAGTYGSQEIGLDATKPSSGAPIVFQPSAGTVTVNGNIDFGQDQFDRLGPENVTVRSMNVKYMRSWRGSQNLRWENIDGMHFDVLDSANVTISGGDFGPCQAPRDDLSCVSRIAGTSSNVVVENTSIHDVTSTDLVNYHVDGMFIRGGSNIVIRNSKFWGNMITNIRVQEQPCCANTNLLIENNWFNVPLQGDGVSARSDAINVDTPVRGNLTIQFNSFAESAGPQVVGPALVKGNLMQNATCAPGVTYAYNMFIPFSAFTGQSPCGPTDKKVASFGYAAPVPGADFDYRLGVVTAGVDAVPVSSGCPSMDFEGTARPQGSACDAGADER